MSIKSASNKTVAIVLASAFIASGVMPASVASAHDRHNAGAHNGNYHNWNNKKHRRFHNRNGRGYRGNIRHSNRKNNNGDLIAAGIIGLAVGAIIADSASKHSHSTPGYTYAEPQYRSYEPGYKVYDPQYDNYSSNEPNVIRYNDVVSYEPWTPGWQAWCEDNYRSFNPRTGTFRGYDGLDHFCVPK